MCSFGFSVEVNGEDLVEEVVAPVQVVPRTVQGEAVGLADSAVHQLEAVRAIHVAALDNRNVAPVTEVQHPEKGS